MNVIIILYVTKVIRIKDGTFEKLIRTAKWSETMDQIIDKLIHEEYKTNISELGSQAKTNLNNMNINSQDFYSEIQTCEKRET